MKFVFGLLLAIVFALNAVAVPYGILNFGEDLRESYVDTMNKITDRRNEIIKNSLTAFRDRVDLFLGIQTNSTNQINSTEVLTSLVQNLTAVLNQVQNTLNTTVTTLTTSTTQSSNSSS